MLENHLQYNDGVMQFKSLITPDTTEDICVESRVLGDLYYPIAPDPEPPPEKVPDGFVSTKDYKDFLNHKLKTTIRALQRQRSGLEPIQEDNTDIDENVDLAEMMWTREEDGTWSIPSEEPSQEEINHQSESLDKIYTNSFEFHKFQGRELAIKFIAAKEHDQKSTETKSNTTRQSDSGANATCVGKEDFHLLHHVRWIDPIYCDTAMKDATLRIEAVGLLYLRNKDGVCLPVTAYYSSDIPTTIISPNSILFEHNFNGYQKHVNARTKTGKLTFQTREGFDDIVFNLTYDNMLWYHTPDIVSTTEIMSTDHSCSNSTQDSSSTATNPTVQDLKINRLSDAAKHELWHQRLMHPGENIMRHQHNHCTGVPKLRGNAFWKCPSCLHGKGTKKPVRHNLGANKTTKKKVDTVEEKIESIKEQIDEHIDEIIDDVYLPDAVPGQHFHADFGFVRGSEYKISTKEGKTVTSIDGKNSYCLIVDRASRYCWLYLSDSKEPPVLPVKLLLRKFKNPVVSNHTFRTDNDQGLNKSKEFRDMLETEGFTIELTGPDSSDQNVRAERPHQDFGRMMRCALHSAGLGPEYWSFALTHAVYIKNRLWHSTLNMTPFQAFTGKLPDLSKLRIFGAKVYCRETGLKQAKLDYHTVTGTFLCFTATAGIINYIDDETGKVRTGRHVMFDEAHFSVPAAKAPLAAQALQRLGYSMRESYYAEERNDIEQTLTGDIYITLSPTARAPTLGTDGSVGFDLFLDQDTVTIEPQTVGILATGVTAKAPTGTYIRIASRSSLSAKRNLDVGGGVIDPDYRGELKIIMKNHGIHPQTLHRGDKIAQFICERVDRPNIKIVPKLDKTSRKGGFGSTDLVQEATKQVLEKTNISSGKPVPSPTPVTTPPIINVVPDDTHAIPTPTSTMPVIEPQVTHVIPDVPKVFRLADISCVFDMPYNIHMSNSPFDHQTHREVDIWGTDTLLGFDLENCNKFGKPKLKQCLKSTPCARLPRWRSELRGAYVTSINGFEINSIADIREHIQKAKDNEEKTVKFGFATIERQALHSQKGIPQLYHDQLNVIGEHLWHLKYDPGYVPDVDDFIPILEVMKKNPEAISKEEQADIFDKLKLSDEEKSEFQSLFRFAKLKKQRKLTRKVLQELDTWEEWEAQEFKQLDDYDAQDTFGPPQDPPPGANLLSLLWVYLVKDDGRKKARCVCNGAKNRRGSVTLAETYASALEQHASRVFWAATAVNNWTAIGADATNAFAEAGAPVAPLYVYCDQQFRNWYYRRKGIKLPKGKVLRVKRALQGHPESPRLWMELIDRIIKELGLTPCTHEPNLYYCKDYKGTGKSVLFLKQVDDFAISCETQDIAEDVIASIDSKMSIKVKKLGLISRFNGVDVLQTRDYIKIYNKTYIEKFCAHHPWLHDMNSADFGIPMRSDNAYIRKLEEADPLSDHDRAKLEESLGFTYRQIIGEVIYALTTCRPDISFAAIKLSQYSATPAKIHYEAAMHLVKYLYDTKDEGIYYWRQHQNPTLPPMPIPTIKHDGNYNDYDIPTRQQHCPNILIGATDSDHAGDVSHRKSVSGVVLKLAGGAVLYKTSYQQTIAQSSTEAEFTAAVDAAKYILYLRTLLDEIGIPQHQATTLYEDNQGALLMAQAQKPTRRTRHMETKYFGLQDWVKRDLVTLERINTSDNYSDALTKAVGTTLFYRHTNFIMGKIVPEYALHKDTNLSFRRIYDMNLSFLFHRFTSREGDKEDMLVSM